MLLIVTSILFIKIQFFLHQHMYWLSPATPKAREILQHPRPSVCPFSHCNSKTHCCIFSKLCRYVHHVMGVCCIVFDIDGMLFEIFMIYLSNLFIFLVKFCSSHVMFSLHFMLFPTFLETRGLSAWQLRCIIVYATLMMSNYLWYTAKLIPNDLDLTFQCHPRSNVMG